ncbi:MAG: hypothetical protein II797_00230, partial [Clostridia bacterium]|nr:hypothetical protein [Clostridia bacterium]
MSRYHGKRSLLTSIGLLLAAAILLPLLLSGQAMGEPAQAKPAVLSDPIDLLTEAGSVDGPNSAHGNHQTRIVQVSSGAYVAVLTGNNPPENGQECQLIRIDPEGNVSVIRTVALDDSQTTVLVMAD